MRQKVDKGARGQKKKQDVGMVKKQGFERPNVTRHKSTKNITVLGELKQNDEAHTGEGGKEGKKNKFLTRTETNKIITNIHAGAGWAGLGWAGGEEKSSPHKNTHF